MRASPTPRWRRSWPTRAARKPRGASDLVPHLLNLHEVYRALLKERAQRGAVDFETTETQIVCDENGRIEKIVPRTRNEAHRLIEEAMLAANVCAADFIAQSKHPALFRVHEGPTPEKKDAAAELPEGDRPRADDQRRPDARRVPGHCRGHQGRGPTRSRSTRCCCARCSRPSTPPINSGHFGLAYRRLHALHQPDPALPRPAGAPRHQGDSGGKTATIADLPTPGEAHAKLRAGGRAAASAASRRRRAVGRPGGGGCTAAPTSAAPTRPAATSRPGSSASYMREHLGEEYGGVVTAATSFGIFVTLDACTSKGWCTSPNSAASTSASTRRARNCAASAPACATPSASRVRVQVSRVDLDGRKIDFRLVDEGEEAALMARARRDKFGDKAGDRSTGAGAVGELAAVTQADRALKAAAGPVRERERVHIRCAPRSRRRARAQRERRSSAAERGASANDPAGVRPRPAPYNRAVKPSAHPLNADLHCHSFVSDGTLSPQALASRAKANGVELWALTDHDEVGGQQRAREAASGLGLPWVSGVEISVTLRRHHGAHRRSGLRRGRRQRSLRAWAQPVAGARSARARWPGAWRRPASTAPSRGRLKYVGNPELISRTHFARHLVEAGMCADTQAVFRKYLVEGRPGYVPHRWASLGDAVRWITQAGGVAVIAHPGRYRFSPNEEFALFSEFKAHGGQGVEVVTGSHYGADYREVRCNGARVRPAGLARLGLSRARRELRRPRQAARLAGAPEPGVGSACAEGPAALTSAAPLPVVQRGNAPISHAVSCHESSFAVYAARTAEQARLRQLADCAASGAARCDGRGRSRALCAMRGSHGQAGVPGT